MKKLKRGSSIVEYMMIVLFLSAALFVFQFYIVRGFAGRWRAIGDVFGGGRQYDKDTTLDCFYFQNPVNILDNEWVATKCYEDCLAARNGFGNPADMQACRGSCNEDVPGYEKCGDTNFSVKPL